MFQRQARQPFPARNLVILGAVVLGFLYILYKSVQKQDTSVPLEQMSEQSDTSNLRPAEWFFALREWPDFRPDLKTYTDALAKIRKSELAARPRDAFRGFAAPWLLEGPANIGARINTIAVHPTNANIIFIGYSHGGVWRTLNGGGSWLPVFDGQIFLSIGDIVFDPLQPNTLYVGTGDPNISGYPFIGDGLWRSTDLGETWENIGLEATRIITQIIPHPSIPNRILVATMGLPFERNNQRGLFTTDNGGTSWQQPLFISNEAGIIDLLISPSDANILYAASWDRIRNNQESVIIGPNARIWKSTDGGANWNPLNGGLPTGDWSRIGLAMDPSNSQHLFASYVSSSLEFFGLFETFDGGETWNQNPCEGLDYGFQSNFAWYFGKIRVNPFNPLNIWLLGVQSYRSQDGGETWSLAAGFNQDVHADHHDLAFLGPQTFLIATDGGLYRSTDNADTWNKFEAIPTTQLYRVAYNPHTPLDYYGGAQDNGTFGGRAVNLNDWPRYFGGDGFQAVFHPTNPEIYYYETQNGGIWGSSEMGGFDDATDGIDPSDRRNWDMQYLLSQHDANVMYTGTYRIYRSQGHLPIWTPVSGDLTDGVIFGNRFHTITTLHESPIDPDLLFVGTTDANVWRGNPLTQNWVNITAGLPDRYVSSVKASPSNPERVFVSQTGYKSNDFSAHIHRSDNQGDTWEPIQGDLPNLAINDLIVLPGHQDTVLFAATDGGVYGSTNGGQHWERLGQGMPIVPVYSLVVNPAQRTLAAGTYARSIFSFPLDSLRLGANSSTFTPDGYAAPRLRISPNPAANQAVLRVENLKSNQIAEISVSDFSGRILWKTQVKGFGIHEEPIVLQDLPAGIYLVYAKTGRDIWGAQKWVITR